MQNIIVVLICLLLGGLGAWIIQNYGHKLGIIDIPNERSSHNQVVPKGGGIGILAAFIFFSLFMKLHVTFWLSALILSIVSFFGDRIELSPKFRLTVQFFCSFVFLAGLFYLSHMEVGVYLLILPLSVFIAGTSNFYNFMDGINGIAGITGVIGFLLMSAYGYFSGGESIYITLCIAIAFSCVGFLPFNIPNANVFMGDVGSILLGFVFACLVVIFSKSVLDFICLSGFIFPFFADELSTMAIRINDKDSLSKPHRKHLYQILANELGIEHWKISFCFGIFQLIVGINILLLRNNIWFVLLTLICYLLVFCFVSILIRKEIYKLKS